MLRARPHRRLTAWIASLAILLGALAPAVSQAVSWATGDDFRWIQICTAAGLELVAVDDAAGADGEGDAAGGFAERCPCCGTHAGSFGLPPAPPVSFSLPVVPDLQPILYHRAPRPLFAWAASHPRAPPRLF